MVLKPFRHGRWSALRINRQGQGVRTELAGRGGAVVTPRLYEPGIGNWLACQFIVPSGDNDATQRDSGPRHLRSFPDDPDDPAAAGVHNIRASDACSPLPRGLQALVLNTMRLAPRRLQPDNVS
jgi:hypothetical protein